jgi:hypothetical protein
METFARAAVSRAALLGLLALTVATVLPYVHAIAGSCAHATSACAASDHRESARRGDGGSTSHDRHCGVCGAFAQGKGRGLAFGLALSVAAPPHGIASAPFVSVVVLSSSDRDVAGARAPPPYRRSA